VVELERREGIFGSRRKQPLDGRIIQRLQCAQ
jgi:hypothetical protein